MRIPLIRTTRLRIRPLVLADTPAVYAYVSNPEVMTYLPEGEMDPSAARAFVARHCEEDAEMHAVVLHESDQLIGHMVFHPWFGHRMYEIGWVFHPDYQNRGFATEAAKALLQYSFETLDAHRVIATCQPENPASYRVMEKIGMRREAHFRKSIYRGRDDWWDEYFYAILKEEWTGAGEKRTV